MCLVLLLRSLVLLGIWLVGQEAAPKKCFLLSTKKKVRGDVKHWLVSDAGEKWSVEMSRIFRGGGGAGLATLGCRVSGVIPRVPSVAVLSLDFSGKLRLLGAMHILAALHGAEASVISEDGLRRLRTPFGRAGLSGGLRLADPGAVLSLLDGPVGCDLGYHVVWCTFQMLRRLANIYGLLQEVSAGAPGSVPVHLLTKVAGDLSSRAGFRGARFLDFRVSLRLPTSPHLTVTR